MSVQLGLLTVDKLTVAISTVDESAMARLKRDVKFEFIYHEPVPVPKPERKVTSFEWGESEDIRTPAFCEQFRQLLKLEGTGHQLLDIHTRNNALDTQIGEQKLSGRTDLCLVQRVAKVTRVTLIDEVINHAKMLYELKRKVSA